MWLILFILIIIAGAIVLVWLRMRERSYLKKPTREALGKELRREVEMEKKIFSDRKERFGKALDRAKIKLTRTTKSD